MASQSDAERARFVAAGAAAGAAQPLVDGTAVLLPSLDAPHARAMGQTIQLQRVPLASTTGAPTTAHPSQVWAVVVVGVRDEVFDELPPSLRGGALVRVVPVMFTQVRAHNTRLATKPSLRLLRANTLLTQGINEMQTIANTVGNSSVQDHVNMVSLAVLQRYFATMRRMVFPTTGAGGDQRVVHRLWERRNGREDARHWVQRLSSMMIQLSASAARMHIAEKNYGLLIKVCAMAAAPAAAAAASAGAMCVYVRVAASR